MSIKIIDGERGYHLTINGFYINHGFNKDVKAIKCDNGIPYGATEWVGIWAIRDFWRKYRIYAVEATKHCVYKSEWGNLIRLEK